MTYDVGRILFGEFPSIVQDYVGSIVDGYKTTWSLPSLIQNVGLTEDVILKLRAIRASCTLEMFEFLSRSPLTSDEVSEFQGLFSDILTNTMCVTVWL